MRRYLKYIAGHIREIKPSGLERGLKSPTAIKSCIYDLPLSKHRTLGMTIETPSEEVSGRSIVTVEIFRQEDETPHVSKNKQTNKKSLKIKDTKCRMCTLNSTFLFPHTTSLEFQLPCKRQKCRYDYTAPAHRNMS